MYNPNRGNSRFGAGRDFRRPSFGGGRSSSDRPMFRTTCSKCGADCQVPFRPTGERPVYCDKCFGENRRSDYKRSDDRNPREQYSNNYENKSENKGANSDGQYKKQFAILNEKLDKILKIISPVSTPVIIPAENLENVIKSKVLVFKPKKPTKKNKKEKSVLPDSKTKTT
jgi:CxxC-x17-CxxC domain-containing protein